MIVTFDVVVEYQKPNSITFSNHNTEQYFPVTQSLTGIHVHGKQYAVRYTCMYTNL